MSSLTLVVVTFGSNELKPSREIWLFYLSAFEKKKEKKRKHSYQRKGRTGTEGDPDFSSGETRLGVRTAR
ncbi:MAG: hypothetical protein RLZZ323_1138 [Bacteroidota bacterium]|jgi:hypothetical protein